MSQNWKINTKNFISDWGKKGWFVLNIFCTIVYLTWRIFFTIPFGYGFISVFVGIALLIVETLGMVEALVHYANMYNTRDYKKPDVPLELYPDVDIFISTYNEDFVLLAKTICAFKRLEYPDKNKVHIYLCDDGHRDTMKLLASKLKVNYLDRDTHEGQKAGNLNHALANSSSPLVVTLDADMLPQSCFLMETIPYFVDAELRNKGKKPEDQIKLGFVQTPQAFYDLDLFQFNLYSEQKIPNEQDYFYRDIEVARTRTNSCIYGGSNTVISREALNDIGGFYTGAITEDFATGILIQKKGYVTLGLGKVLASGMSANELQNLIQQRVRWARGVISTGRKMHIFTSKDLSFGQKMNYWASIWYWYAPIKRFFYIMSPILYAVFGYMIFRCTLWEVLLFWLPMYVTSNISLSRLSNNIRNTKWTSIYEYALFPYMLVPVVLETFGISLKKFKVTNKSNDGSKRKNGESLIYQIPVFILIVLSIIGIINCIRIMFDSGSMGPIVVLFWLIVNLYNMVMCSFFLSGREAYRKAERVEVQIPATLHVNGVDYACITKDVSETGAAVYLDKPHLLNVYEEAKVSLEIRDRKYFAEMMCEVKFTKEDKDRENPWLYSMEFIGFKSEQGYDNLLGICYDRIPTKPQGLQKRAGFYDDLSTNISRRSVPVFQLKRHFPRIEVNNLIAYTGKDGKAFAKVIDYNYQFISMEGKPLNDEITFHFDKHDLKAVLSRRVKNMYLYEIVDFNKVYSNQDKCDEIMEFVLRIAKEKQPDLTQVKKKVEMIEFNEMSLV